MHWYFGTTYVYYIHCFPFENVDVLYSDAVYKQKGLVCFYY